jgi:hypothetical protein
MARVTITKELEEKINKKFKKESIRIFDLMSSLEKSPQKGKIVTQIGGILIKELKYGSFRFYFLVDGYKIKILDDNELVDLLIKFVNMSDKRDQQETIDKIKNFLRIFGKESLKE